ncbi:hypothetical protein CONLIGDRAFT_467800 [Coniochaeta ligniaria NRRL 30616]|uniref:Zn(2)-C6 fungal-type domain-containing protein n=1 Tax=Coniochaeta ligniaria NRRL 30616 TaxID=1408157 RepID=A0A1J7IFS2_9PEZI|nr:hypothetical protein CONLIGDRAFT_467800 [Coniochaeta ligniaria NRRL 30616]
MDLGLPESNTSLSVRTSCERCRFHKLKCIPQSVDGLGNATPCQRCARAMVDCVFSRRKKPNRAIRDPAAEEKAINVDNDDDDHHPLPPTPAKSPVPIVRAGPSPTADEDRTPRPGSTPTMTWTADQMGHDLPLVDMWVLASMGGTMAESWPESAAMMDAETPSLQCLFDGHDMADVAVADQRHPMGGLCVTDVQDADESHETSGGLRDCHFANATGPVAFSPNNKPEGSAAAASLEPNVEALLRLASDMHARLVALRQGPWSTGPGPATLDEYPIGTVMHLSLQFVQVAAAMRSVCRGPRHMATALDHDVQHQLPWEATSFASAQHTADRLNVCLTTAHPWSTPSSCHLDVPAAFILTSCSVMLVQLFDLVLSHLQTYLRSQARNGVRLSTEPGKACTVDPNLCLGKLPPLNESHTRVHTALSLLVDGLGKAQEALGFSPHTPAAGGPIHDATVFAGSIERWDPASTMMWGTPLPPPAQPSVSGLQDAFVALRKRAAETKELLRETMGL